jgi:hypothetical protein
MDGGTRLAMDIMKGEKKDSKKEGTNLEVNIRTRR